MSVGVLGSTTAERLVLPLVGNQSLMELAVRVLILRLRRADIKGRRFPIFSKRLSAQVAGSAS